jgi:hypothetical protein
MGSIDFDTLSEVGEARRRRLPVTKETTFSPTT